jgi:hypothetical protein
VPRCLRRIAIRRRLGRAPVKRRCRPHGRTFDAFARRRRSSGTTSIATCRACRSHPHGGAVGGLPTACRRRRGASAGAPPLNAHPRAWWRDRRCQPNHRPCARARRRRRRGRLRDQQATASSSPPYRQPLGRSAQTRRSPSSIWRCHATSLLRSATIVGRTSSTWTISPGWWPRAGPGLSRAGRFLCGPHQTTCRRRRTSRGVARMTAAASITRTARGQEPAFDQSHETCPVTTRQPNRRRRRLSPPHCALELMELETAGGGLVADAARLSAGFRDRCRRSPAGCSGCRSGA